ncbi:MAG: 16S rRNA (uracil1498-N3)-methyltransferase [Candidatus Endobugula sp.]|jgi:16S rRNA (uracil1498-N3)-methyltransferase
MHIPRIYIPQAFSEHTSLELDKAAMHHLVTVMRMKVGHQFMVFNGRPVDGVYGEFVATLSHVDKKKAQVEVGKFSLARTEPSLRIHLGACVIKNDRMDWLLQKATELGVTEITPLFSQNTDVKIPAERIEKKVEHWQKIVVNACQQSGRVTIPVIHAPQVLDTWLPLLSERHCKLILHPYVPPYSFDALSASKKPSKLALLVGPEGGLSEQEVSLAIANQFSGMRLGPRILRAETAPLVAMSILMHQLGDC